MLQVHDPEPYGRETKAVSALMAELNDLNGLFDFAKGLKHLVRGLQSIIGREVRGQISVAEDRPPGVLIASIDGRRRQTHWDLARRALMFQPPGLCTNTSSVDRVGQFLHLQS